MRVQMSLHHKNFISFRYLSNPRNGIDESDVSYILLFMESHAVFITIQFVPPSTVCNGCSATMTEFVTYIEILV
jgi:hypothetical protein